MAAVTAILSARSPELIMVDHVFGKVGDVVRRGEMEKANRDLGSKKQHAEFVAH